MNIEEVLLEEFSGVERDAFLNSFFTSNII